MSVEASCRKYLDAIAEKLHAYYNFDVRCYRLTIGVVLRAKDGIEGVKRGPQDENVY
ncbi:hypothetical protein MP228_007557 [Amoeboaphelidium protococcarum]|nr:hypothetical protein MP228_007557 [Amoeboaphelidium protococcarum]